MNSIINVEEALRDIDLKQKHLYQQQISHLYNIEWKDMNNILNLLKSQNIKTIADIGANVGVSLIKFYEFLHPFTVCYCFEPDENNFKVLSYFASCLLSRDINIECYNTGIFYGKSESRVKGVAVDNNQPNKSPGGYFLDVLSPIATTDLGPTAYFDDKIFKLNEFENLVKEPLDLVKIDVEGSEYNILEHSPLIKQSKFLLVEFHNNPVSIIETFIHKHLSMYNIIQTFQKTYLLKNEKNNSNNNN